VTSTNPTGGAAAWSASEVGQYNSLTQVACPTKSLCVAVDDAGNVLSTKSPNGAASAWTLARVDPGNSLTGVSCPTAHLCAASDDAGNVLTSTDPTAGASGWTLAHIDPFPLAPPRSTSPSLVGISCASRHHALLCVAFDDAHVFASTHPGHGVSAWTHAKVDDFGLSSLSCPATSLCLALDSFGDILSSRNPAGRVATWKRHILPFYDSTVAGLQLSCPSVSVCVTAAGYFGGCPGDVGFCGVEVFASANPTGRRARAWRDVGGDATQGGEGLVSCPSISLCFLINGTDDAASTNPTRPRTWHHTHIEGSSEVTWIACPSASRCVATDAKGDVVLGRSRTRKTSVTSGARVARPVADSQRPRRPSACSRRAERAAHRAPGAATGAGSPRSRAVALLHRQTPAVACRPHLASVMGRDAAARRAGRFTMPSRGSRSIAPIARQVSR